MDSSARKYRCHTHTDHVSCHVSLACHVLYDYNVCPERTVDGALRCMLYIGLSTTCYYQRSLPSTSAPDSSFRQSWVRSIIKFTETSAKRCMMASADPPDRRWKSFAPTRFVKIDVELQKSQLLVQFGIGRALNSCDYSTILHMLA